MIHIAHDAHLTVLIYVLLEVIVFGDDSFRDKWLEVDADGGQQGSLLCLSQPCDLCRLLEIFVVQVQASLHGHNLTVNSSVGKNVKR